METDDKENKKNSDVKKSEAKNESSVDSIVNCNDKKIEVADDTAAKEKAKDSDTQKHLFLAGREIILVGTAHVSAKSISEVTAAVENEKPDTVGIELDDKRLQNLTDPESWRKMDIIQVLKNKQGFLMLANIVLSSYQKRMGMESGVKPGDEMLAAINKAKELNIPQEMVDRPIAVTMRRAWAENSWWGKCKLLSAMIASTFTDEKVDSAEIENLKNKSEMDSMMNELSDYMPDVKRVLIDERDRYLACHIWQCKGNKVLAVLGAGHLNGVQAHLEKIAAGEEKPECSEIESVPAKKTGAKIASWIIPILIVALIVVGFIFGGKAKGWDMLSAWVLWNGTLAALGSLIAGAHPVTILVALLGAPITSLCPVIGIGMVTGLVQALICKPKVADMENMQKDAGSLKGFYKNRILRVLLVFILSSIGSSVGTFVAGASFVKTISTFFDKIVAAVKSWF
ncbi:MAG: TraB/GumN family protein [Treponema sp.]